MSENDLTKICQKIPCSGSDVNAQAASLLAALTGEQETFDIGGSQYFVGSSNQIPICDSSVSTFSMNVSLITNSYRYIITGDTLMPISNVKGLNYDGAMSTLSPASNIIQPVTAFVVITYDNVAVPNDDQHVTLLYVTYQGTEQTGLTVKYQLLDCVRNGSTWTISSCIDADPTKCEIVGSANTVSQISFNNNARINGATSLLYEDVQVALPETINRNVTSAPTTTDIGRINIARVSSTPESFYFAPWINAPSTYLYRKIGPTMRSIVNLQHTGSGSGYTTISRTKENITIKATTSLYV